MTRGDYTTDNRFGQGDIPPSGQTGAAAFVVVAARTSREEPLELRRELVGARKIARMDDGSR